MTEDYEVVRPVEIEMDGKKYAGTFRVISGSVLVYYKDQIKYAQCGMDRPELLASWILKDICRKLDWKNRARPSSDKKT